MVVEDVAEGVGEVLGILGGLALWLQTLGIIIILWIIFEVVMLRLNLKRMREIYTIKEDMKRIERKIDTILKR